MRLSTLEIAGACLLYAMLVSGAAYFAILTGSLFSISYAVIVAVVLPIAFFLRRDEKEMIQRQDELINQATKDDPKEMARWVP